MGNRPRRLGLNIPGFGCVSGTKGFKKHPIICTTRVSFERVDKAGVRPCVPGCAHTGGALRARIFELECVCAWSEAAQGRGSDIEDGLNPVLHSSGRPEFIRVRIIPPQDQRKRILNKSSCWGENAIVPGERGGERRVYCACVVACVAH